MAHITQLQELLKSDSRIGHWIQVLNVTWNEPSFGGAYPRFHLIHFLDVFPEVAPNLQNLRVFQLSGTIVSEFSSSSRIRTFFQALSNMSSIHTIEFIDCLIAKDSLVSLIGAFPGVSTVIWRGNQTSLLPPLLETSEHFLPLHPIRIHSIYTSLQDGTPRNNLFENLLPAIITPSTCGLQVLHLDLFIDKRRKEWRPLRPMFCSLGPTLRQLTLRLPILTPINDLHWLTCRCEFNYDIDNCWWNVHCTAETESHIDLSLLPNLTSFHFSSLQYTEASLHILRGLSGPHLRKITLDTTFDFTSHFKAKDFAEHDAILASPPRTELQEVLVRYFGAVTPKKARSKIISVFSKTNNKNLLRVVKISSHCPKSDWEYPNIL